MAKQQINIRVQPEWLEIVDEAAALRSRQLGVKVTRTSFIELAAVAYLEAIEKEGGKVVEHPDEWTWLMESLTHVVVSDDEAGTAWMAEASEWQLDEVPVSE